MPDRNVTLRVQSLRESARRTRRLATSLSVSADQQNLIKFAEEQERQAAELERAGPELSPVVPPVVEVQIQVQQQQQQETGPPANPDDDPNMKK